MMKKIQFNHRCLIPSCSGVAGEIIEVTSKNKEAAAEIVKRGGAVVVEEAPPEPAPVKRVSKPKPKPKKDEDK